MMLYNYFSVITVLIIVKTISDIIIIAKQNITINRQNWLITHPYSISSILMVIIA